MADCDPVGGASETCGTQGTDAGGANGSDVVVSPKKKSWIAIKLVDEDGKPVPSEEYRVILPDGSPVEGDLDKKGFARINGIDPGTCKVTFTNQDKASWH